MTEAVIGRPIARPNARRAASGRGRHVADLGFKRLVDVAFVRSPYAHARIVGIETREAEAQPSVFAVLTGTDLAERTRPWLGTMKNAPSLLSVPQYGMAVDRARWQGEPLAAVVAEGRARAEDAAEHVRVEWEELPAVADVETALEEGAPILHPSLGTNRLYERLIENGDTAAAFSAAHRIVEGEFRFGRHTGVPLEARAIVADYDPGDRKLTLHYGGQAPHMTQVLFARHLGLEERDVRVIAYDVGGSYGIKSHHYGDEFTVAALAMLLARPVRYWADRLESFVSDIHARDHVLRGRLAVDEDGRFTALEIEDLVGGGAYSSYPRTSSVEANQVLNVSGGSYAIENYRARTRVAFQNKVPISQYRGVGHPVAILATEALIDRAAAVLGVDPAELRQRNFVPDDAYPVRAPSGVGLDDLSHQACMEKLIALMDYGALCADREEKRQRGVLRGIGLASFIKGTNPGPQIYGPAGVPISAQDGCTVRPRALRGGYLPRRRHRAGARHRNHPRPDRRGIGRCPVRGGDRDHRRHRRGALWRRHLRLPRRRHRRRVREAGRARALRDEILDLAATLLQADPATLELRDGAVVESAGGETRMALAELGDIAFFRSGELPDGVYPSLTQTRRFRVPEYGLHQRRARRAGRNRPRYRRDPHPRLLGGRRRRTTDQPAPRGRAAARRDRPGAGRRAVRTQPLRPGRPTPEWHDGRLSGAHGGRDAGYRACPCGNAHFRLQARRERAGRVRNRPPRPARYSTPSTTALEPLGARVEAIPITPDAILAALGHV